MSSIPGHFVRLCAPHIHYIRMFPRVWLACSSFAACLGPGIGGPFTRSAPEMAAGCVSAASSGLNSIAWSWWKPSGRFGTCLVITRPSNSVAPSRSDEVRHACVCMGHTSKYLYINPGFQAIGS